MNDTRSRLRSIGARIVYSADRFLAFPPLLQVLVVIGLATLLVCFFAVVGLLLFAIDPTATAGESLWWSLAMMLDGGTMGSNPPFSRAFALTITITGVFALSLLTGAFASNMSARLTDLRAGHSPAIERGHIVVLGFDSHVSFLARELAHWQEPLVVVAMAQEDKETIERALKPARFAPGNRRVRFVIRHGDPRSEAALARVSIDQARAIIVVPPAHLDDEATVHWSLSVLLALRRATGPTFKGHIVVEVRRSSAERVLRLAAEPDVAGPGAFEFELLASDDIIARVLAQSARQEGIYFALREILSFEGNEIRAMKVDSALVGRTLEQAHERTLGGVLLGLLCATGETVLVPQAPDHVVQATDRLYVLLERSRRLHFTGKFPTRTSAPPSVHAVCRSAEKVLVIGQNRTLPLVLRELDEILPASSEIIVMGASSPDSLASLFDELRPTLNHVRLRCDPRRPMDLIASGDSSLVGMDAIVILGCEDERDERGDASALSTLLWLRHSMRKAGRTAQRVVTEVRDAHSARSVASHATDFLVSTDVVAMLLARAATEPETGRVYREVLSATGYEMCVRPREVYLGPDHAVFGDVMAIARGRGELAVGIYVPADAAHPSGTRGVRLNPRRDHVVPSTPGTSVIVLAKPDASERVSAPPASSVDPGLLL